MICSSCKNGQHDSCKDCPCHHLNTQRLEDGTLAPVKANVKAP